MLGNKINIERGGSSLGFRKQAPEPKTVIVEIRESELTGLEETSNERSGGGNRVARNMFAKKDLLAHRL